MRFNTCGLTDVWTDICYIKFKVLSRGVVCVTPLKRHAEVVGQEDAVADATHDEVDAFRYPIAADGVRRHRL